MGRLPPILVVSGLVLGCGEQPATPQAAGGAGGTGGVEGGGGYGGCLSGQLEVDGLCIDAGLPEQGCGPGAAHEDPLDEQSECLAAGVPPSWCGEGFESDGDHGCTAILPEAPCEAGLMALPGETQCRPIAPCADGSWGDIPVETDTQYVDGSYAGGSNDGTSAHPWLTVQQAVDVAAPGAIVAIAAGSYSGAVSVTGKAVRLWGRCPAMVELVATGNRVLNIGAGADGTEVRDLAMTGPVGWSAVQVADASAVRFERVWLHDTTGSRGMDIVEGTGLGTSVTVVDSLIDRTRTMAIMVWGSELTMERTVVRDTQPSLNSGIARGLNVAVNLDTATPSTAVVRRCALLRNGDLHVATFASSLEVSDTLIRETLPAVGVEDFGNGLQVQDALGIGSVATVVGTVIEQSQSMGVSVLGSELTLEGVVVRDVEVESATGLYGYGVQLRDGYTSDLASLGTVRFALVEGAKVAGWATFGADAELHGVRARAIRPSDAEPEMGLGLFAGPDATGLPTVLVRGSVVEDCRGTGVQGWATAYTLDHTVVRGTRPAAPDHDSGQGLSLVMYPGAGPSTLDLRGSLIEDNTTAAVILWGSDGTIEQSALVGTASAPGSGRFGDGVVGYPYGGRPSHLTLRGAVLDDHQRAGVLVEDSVAAIEGCVVRNIAPQSNDGLMGDGIAAIRNTLPTEVTIAATRVESTDRAGVASFGATLSLHRCLLRCNPIQLNGELWNGQPATIQDQGGNVCDCAGGPEDCKVLSSSLQPPSAMAEPDPTVPEPGEGH